MFKDKRPFTSPAYVLLDMFLRQHYPFVFTKYVPLKIGIYEDILIENPEIDPMLLSRFLHHHTKKYMYLKTAANHPVRYDLQGNPVESLTPLNRVHTIAKYKERLEAIIALLDKKTANILVGAGKTNPVEKNPEESK